MSSPVMALLESNTTGTGRQFALAAARLGYQPVILTDNPDRYPFLREDRIPCCQVDTGNLAAVLDECRRFCRGPGLAGVTTSSDCYIDAASAVAETLGRPAPPTSKIRACRDKERQRRILAEAGVGVPAFRSATTVEEAISSARELGPPVVIKPVTGTGSLGVRACADLAEVEHHAAALLAQRENERGQPIPRRILVEQLVSGPEYSVETFQGRVIGVTQKYLGDPPAFVEIGHDFPAAIAGELGEHLGRAALLALKALGLGWGPAHTEARLTSDGVKIIELNPRLAGGMIPQLMRLAWGIDLVMATVALAAGLVPRIDPECRHYASIRFVLAPGEGTLIGVDGLDQAAGTAGVDEARMYVRTGDRLRRFDDFRDRIGHVITVGTTLREARTTAERALAMIHSRVETPAD